jgi:hypothetical protein
VTRSTEAGTCPAERDWTTTFDHHDAALSRNPYPVYDQLRDKCPVSRTQAWGGFWVVTGHDEVAEVAKNDVDYSSGVVLEDGTIQGVTIPSVGQTRPVIPIELDPPENLKYRKLLNPFYTVQAVRQREDEIRALVSGLVDEFIEDGECDLVHSLTLATPAIVTLREVGLPIDRWEEFVAWVDTMIHDSGHNPEGAMQAGMAVYGEYLKAIAERRENGLRDDVISTLMSSTIDGRPVTDEQIVDIGILLLFGGLDTTSAASATTFLHLAQNPDIRSRIAGDRAITPHAVEEYLRFVTPVQGNSRTVTNDIELGGVQLRKGERLLALWAGANHDPAHAPDPDTVKFDRGGNPHMAFGIGSHRCLGAHLARTMFRLMLEEVLERLPDYRVKPGADVEWFDNISSVYGVKSLPIVFTPGKRGFGS